MKTPLNSAADLKFNNIGARIRARREELGLSLTQLADAASLTKSGLHSIENKPNTRPAADTMYLLAWALECSIEYLMDVPRLPCRHAKTADSLALENLALKKRLAQIAKAIEFASQEDAL